MESARKSISHTIPATHFRDVALPYLHSRASHTVLDYVFVDNVNKMYEHIIATPGNVADAVSPEIPYDEVHIYGTRKDVVNRIILPLIRDGYTDYAQR